MEGLDRSFDAGSLVALRAAVTAQGGRLGLAGERLADLLLIAHELASNVIRHGGGQGQLRLWVADGVIYCRVADFGPGFLEPVTDVGRQTPAAGAVNGRGLWLVRHLADDVAIDSDGLGTIITAAFRLSARSKVD